MPADDPNTLRKRARRWCLLAEQATDARIIEALRAEIARLMEQIGQLEAKETDNQSEPGKLTRESGD